MQKSRWEGRFISVLRGPHGAIRATLRGSAELRSGIPHFAAPGDMTQLPDAVALPPIKAAFWIRGSTGVVP